MLGGLYASTLKSLAATKPRLLAAPKTTENSSCRRDLFCYLSRPCFGNAEARVAVETGFNGLNSVPVPVGAGGHNNIKNNPVFRGMVWRRFGEPGS